MESKSLKSVPDAFADTFCPECGYKMVDGVCAVEAAELHYSAKSKHFTTAGINDFVEDCENIVPDIREYCSVTRMVIFTHQYGTNARLKRCVLTWRPNRQVKSFISQLKTMLWHE